MSLEHAVLGWLSTGPGSGYDLVRQLDQGLGWFWSAPHSQIYPRLKDLEKRGLITSRPEIVGERLEKRIYEITDAGRTAVREWSSEPPTYPPNRDAERLKLIFGDHGDLVALRKHLETHLQHFRARRESLRDFLDVLTSRKHRRIEQRISEGPSEAHQELMRALRDMAYRGDMKRAENEISWAEDGLLWLDAFESRWNVAEGALPASGL